MEENSELKYFYDSFSKELLGKFQRVHHLIPDHHESTGSYHEEILRVALRNFLSKRYSVKTGFIFKDAEHKSKQIDILIVDEQAPIAYLFQEGDFAIVVPEAVVACIEVKTTLDKNEFKSAVANILSAKSVLEYPSRMAGIIFGYQKSNNPRRRPSDRLMEKWFKDATLDDLGSGNDFLGPDAILWLNNNYAMFPFIPSNNSFGGTKHYHSMQHSPDETNGWQITNMLMLISESCKRVDFHYRRFANEGKQVTKLHSSFMNIEFSEYSYILGKGKGVHYLSNDDNAAHP